MAPSLAVSHPANEVAAEDALPKVKYNPQDLEDVYFGGLLKFKTKIVWVNATFFFLIHFIGAFGFYYTFQYMIFDWNPLPFIYMYLAGFVGGEGVTVGAHRLWTHRSYKAKLPLRILLIIAQTVAGQNCCHKWVKDHRQHHKYSDTNADPHNATRGFFYSHIGWLMMRKHPETKEGAKTIYMADIEADPVVMFQKRHFKKMFLLFGVLIPWYLPILFWGETVWKAFCIGVLGRYIFLLNIAWSVNSFAHLYGNKPYDRNIMPVENIWVSIAANGEGWHNYHHAFPWDYKTSEYGVHWNLSRIVIEFFEKIGWAYDLKEASEDVIRKTIAKKGDGTHQNSKNIYLTRPAAVPEPECDGW